MLKKYFILSLCIFSFNIFANENIEIINKESLILNGNATRSKLFLDLYEIELFVKTKSNNAIKIINSNDSMALKLVVTSSLVSSDKMKTALIDGFENNKNLPKHQKNLDLILNTFNEDTQSGDIFEFIYVSNQGIKVSKNNKVLVEKLGNLDFKKALFSVWLGENPVQDSVKDGLLGLD